MKFLSKSMLAIATLGTASLAFAADPLANTQWQTFDDKTQKPTAVIKITEFGGVLTGKMVSANTADGEKYIGTTIISGLKSVGGGEYASGKIYDPSNGKKYKLTAKLNGKTLKLKGHLGPFYRSQTWKQK